MADQDRPQPGRQLLPRPFAKPTSSLEGIDVVDELRDTERLVVGREEAVEVLEGVRALPDDRREALIMRFALGMDNKEIARALGGRRAPPRCSSIARSSNWKASWLEEWRTDER